MNDPVSPQMRDIITAQLKQIEQEEGAHILLAVESGSRAWGFHSPDSDYDVRFVYARPMDWRYRLDKTRDVIERPIDAELDISGWELAKALRLMTGTNAALLEWLQSPIVYRADAPAVDALLTLARRVIDRRAMTWHYSSMLDTQITRHKVADGAIKLKRYFYAIRPALTLRWMRLQDAATPPMHMAALRAGCALPDDVAQDLDTLTARKMESLEAAHAIVSVPAMDELIFDEQRAATDWLSTAPKPAPVDLWAEVNSLHMELSRSAFASDP